VVKLHGDSNYIRHKHLQQAFRIESGLEHFLFETDAFAHADSLAHGQAILRMTLRFKGALSFRAREASSPRSASRRRCN
jgi:hypothetical protein